MKLDTQIEIKEYEESMKQEVKKLAYESFENPRDAYWATRWVNRCDKAYIALINNKIVGVVEIGFIKLKAGLHSQLGYIFVHPKYRRMGIGSVLVDRSIDFLRDNRVVAVWAVTSVGNIAARKLFESKKFVLIENPVKLRDFLYHEDIQKLLRRLYYEEGDILYYKEIQ